MTFFTQGHFALKCSVLPYRNKPEIVLALQKNQALFFYSFKLLYKDSELFCFITQCIENKTYQKFGTVECFIRMF